MGVAPRVSIGMPVRNGQRFIREAIASIQAQTFEDFELIITDNASTDSTEQICRQIAAADPRVRYVRNPTNIGPAANYNRSFELASGEYFRWHAHDDLCTPDHLQRCVEAMDANPDVVLVYPQTQIIDDVGNPLDTYDFHPADSGSVARRFSSLVLVNHRMHRAVEIFGLMRSSALRRTPLQGAYARGDSVLLVRMALLGRFLKIPGRLFLSRSHTSQSMQTLPSASKSGRSLLTRLLGTGPLPPPEWWDASRKGKANFPEWNLMKEYFRSISAAPLSAAERISCHGTMLKWMALNIPKLGRDVVFAAATITSRISARMPARLPATDAAPVTRAES